MKIVTAQVPHPLLRCAFPQEGKENKEFPSPLGRLSQSSQHRGRQRRLCEGQGEGPEQLLKIAEIKFP
jgi:hypothetical protein